MPEINSLEYNRFSNVAPKVECDGPVKLIHSFAPDKVIVLRKRREIGQFAVCGEHVR